MFTSKDTQFTENPGILGKYPNMKIARNELNTICYSFEKLFFKVFMEYELVEEIKI